MLGISGWTPAVQPDAVLKEVHREKLTASSWTTKEQAWIRDHVGLIFHDDGGLPRFNMSEQIDIAHALGVRRVKTWLKADNPGDSLALLKGPIYQRVLKDFDVVLFDVCPNWLFSGPYDDTMSGNVRKEYEQVAYYCASTFRGTKKTFLLSLFMETNLFWGSEQSYHPDFPTVRFFQDAVEGVRIGAKRANDDAKSDVAKVYSVIEVGKLPREYIKNLLSQTNADLYAVSYYATGELGRQDATLQECVDTLSKAIPHDGPFGKHNIMVGELGRNVFEGGNNGEDQDQLEYLKKTLKEAQQNQMPFVFVFWLTDQERFPTDGFGLMGSKRAGAQFRRSWHALQQAFGGKMPHRPAASQVTIDAIRPLDFNPKPGQPVRVEIDIANRSTWSQAAAPAKDVLVQLAAGTWYETRISLAPDEIVTLRAEIPAPWDNQAYVFLSPPGSVAKVEQSFSFDRADLVVDRIYTEPADPKPGDKVKLFAVVRNTGNIPITDFAIHFHIDDFTSIWVAWGCIYGDTKLVKDQSLPIGGGFPWIATSGLHTIRAWVNPDGSREANYSNNMCYSTITIK
jgi:hypothetical protein